MKKLFGLMLLCATVIYSTSCEKESIISSLDNTIWKCSLQTLGITDCPHVGREGQSISTSYCEECYGWQEKGTNLYYVFREDHYGYYATHLVKYWKNKEGAPYYDYPDKHYISVYGLLYDFKYPNLSIFHSVGRIKIFTSIDEAKFI